MPEFNKTLDQTNYLKSQMEYLIWVNSWLPFPWVEFEVDDFNLDIQDGPLGQVAILNQNGFCWMTTLPIDLLDHECLTDCKGDILLTGLGLGLGVIFANDNQSVKSITVIEKNEKLAEIMLSILQPFIAKPLDLIIADADAWQPKRCYNFAYLDHAQVQIPFKTIEKYKQFSKDVVCWSDVRREVEKSWQ